MHFRPQRDLHFYFPNLMSRDKIFKEEKKNLNKKQRFTPKMVCLDYLLFFGRDKFRFLLP
jgi:hypothetical protein